MEPGLALVNRKSPCAILPPRNVAAPFLVKEKARSVLSYRATALPRIDATGGIGAIDTCRKRP